MELFWQESIAEKWLDSARQQRLPHAVLLAGPRGVGKRAAAAWMAAGKLGLEAGPLPEYPFDIPEHADLHWLSPPEDKTAILIDQVRAMVSDLSLTSYEGHGKVAVLEPANTLTHNAANSLLKTLEEPPGDTLIILVADRTGSLPPTILSRCQRVDVRVPAESEGLAWLDRLQPGTEWAEPLRLAGDAPLGALSAAEQLETGLTMAREFAAVGAGRKSPVEVAAAWSKLDAGYVLEWLARRTQSAVRLVLGGRDVARAAAVDDEAIDESVLRRIDSRNLFCYLDNINRLRGQPRGSYNVQLALEGLLIDWATGLRDANRRNRGLVNSVPARP